MFPITIDFLRKINKQKVHSLLADISDTDLLYEMIRDCDVVVHLAGLRLPECEKNPDKCYFVNEFMTKAIGEMCKMLEKRMIFSSTCSNYGVSKKPATEINQLNPIAHYAKSKVNAEEHLMKMQNCTILRFATAFGVGSNFTRDDVMVNDFVRSVVMKEELEVYNPTSFRPNCHVKDIAQAIQLVIENPNKVQNKIYNVGINSMNKTKGEIAQIICNHYKYKLTEPDKGDPRNYIVDFSRFNKFFDFKPKYTLESGIKELIVHYEKEKALEFVTT